ncbi:MAG: hypothetical protein ACE5G9_10855 [Nitrospinales bacterium]
MQASSENSEPKQNVQEQFDQLRSTIRSLASELETIKENIQKRKRETTTLKIMLYTGLFLLMVGFIYSNTTLQRVQLKSLEEDFQALTRQSNQDLTAVQNVIFRQMRRLKDELKNGPAGKQNENRLRETLAGATSAVAHIRPADPEFQKLVEQFALDSDALLQSFAQSKKEPAPGKETENDKTPPGK